MRNFAKTFLRAGGPAPIKWGYGVDFPTATARYARGGGLTGAADGKAGTISFWLRIDSGNGIVRYVLQGGTSDTNGIRINFLATSSDLQCLGYTSAGGVTLRNTTSISLTSGGSWRHVMWSWDVAAGRNYLYIDDVNRSSVQVQNNNNIDWTTSNYYIGANSGNSEDYEGCLAEYWQDNVEINANVTANRRKFITAGGDPVFLGNNGQIPNGSSPLIYLTNGPDDVVADFGTNRGSGGNFTHSGSPAVCSNSPIWG